MKSKLENIYIEIEEAKEKGLKCITIQGALSVPMSNILKEKGFSVILEELFQFSGSAFKDEVTHKMHKVLVTKISWSHFVDKEFDSVHKRFNMKSYFLKAKIDKKLNGGENFIALKKEEIVSAHIYDTDKESKIEFLTVYFMLKRYNESFIIKINKNVITLEKLKELIFDSLSNENESNFDFTENNLLKIID